MDREGYFEALVRMFGRVLKAIDTLPQTQRLALLARLNAVRQVSHDFGYGVDEDIDANKTDVRIVDFVDAGHPALLRMWDKRQRGYRAMGYLVAAESTSDDGTSPASSGRTSTYQGEKS